MNLHSHLVEAALVDGAEAAAAVVAEGGRRGAEASVVMDRILELLDLGVLGVQFLLEALQLELLGLKLLIATCKFGLQIGDSHPAHQDG